MIRKYYKKQTKSMRRRYSKVICIIAIGFLIIIGLVVKQAFYPPIFPLFHGPHLSVALYKAGISEAEVLGSKSIHHNSKSKPTPTPTKKITNLPSPTPILPTSTPALPTPMFTSAPSPTPIPIPTTNIVLNNMGISAGGDLIFQNQDYLDIYFSQLHELGVKWLRWSFEWEEIQASGPGNYNWSGADRVVNTASQYGIKTLGIITYTPTWARKVECQETYTCAPADPAAFGKFAGEVASRYAPQGLHYWEIWNEPNYHGFWKPSPDVSSYVAILKSAYANIKQVDPLAFVLSAGLASAGDEENNIAPITFIRSLYELDPTVDFDGIALHPYTYPTLPSYPASWNSWQQINSIRQLMIDHGDSGKQIWITEYGAPTNGPGNAHDTTQLENFVWGQDYMTESAQAAIMDNTLSLYSQLSGPKGPFFWYSLKDSGTSKDTPENFFGLLRFDGSKKPAYDVFRNAIFSNQ